MLTALISISLVSFLVGLIMVNRIGNYENKWGMMLWYGAAATTIFSLISIGIFLIGLI